jgi:hypothetical protein
LLSAPEIKVEKRIKCRVSLGGRGIVTYRTVEVAGVAASMRTVLVLV